MHKVMLVDDEPLVRASLRAMRDWAEDDFSMEADASNGLEALEALERHDPDIVLLDMHMPRCNGIEFLKSLAGRPVRPAVAVLSAYDDFALVREAFTLGACDYILKADMTGEKVLEVLRRAAAALREREEAPSTVPGPHEGIEEPSLAGGRSRRIDERLRQQILRDLLASGNPESFGPILEELDIRLRFPLRICEYRPLLPELPDEDEGGRAKENRRADTVLAYLKDALRTRKDGQFVFLPGNRGAWLAYGAENDAGSDDAEKADATSREVSDLCLQTLNIGVDWAVGERVEGLGGLPTALRNADALFSPASRPVRRAKAYIRKRYASPDLSLADAAEYAGVSRTHLSALFSKECGECFGDYLTRLRIEAARRLLEDSRLKVYEVAERSGFRSVEHFSRTFKKITGSTPNRCQGDAGRGSS